MHIRHLIARLAIPAAVLSVTSCSEPIAPAGDPLFARGGGNPAARVTTVEVVPAQAEIVVGATVQVSAIGTDRKGNVVDGVTFEWSSSDPAIASVDNTGLVTGITAGGPVTITASTGGRKSKTGSAEVNVVVPLPSGWFALAPMLSARRNFGAASVGNNLYVMGGFGAEDGVEVYSVGSNTWTARAPMPTPRHELASASVNGIVYAIGGQGAGILSTVEAHDPSTNTWTTRAPMPTARTGLVVVAVNSIIYAIGGCSDNECSSGGELSTVEAYDHATDTWTTKAPMPTARGYAAAAASNGIIYVTGGRDVSSTNYINTLEAYDPATNTWTTKTPMPTGRQWHAMAALNGLVYSIAGYNGTPGVQLSSVEVYDPNADSWSTGTAIPTHRLYLSAVTIGGVIYAVGGFNTVDGVESLLATLEGFRP